MTAPVPGPAPHGPQIRTWVLVDSSVPAQADLPMNGEPYTPHVVVGEHGGTVALLALQDRKAAVRLRRAVDAVIEHYDLVEAGQRPGPVHPSTGPQAVAAASRPLRVLPGGEQP